MSENRMVRRRDARRVPPPSGVRVLPEEVQLQPEAEGVPVRLPSREAIAAYLASRGSTLFGRYFDLNQEADDCADWIEQVITEVMEIDSAQQR